MLIKLFYVLSVSIALIECAKLLRTPKVYNAIITTDEHLTPSQAFPVLQPVIQPAIPIFSPYYATSFFDPYSRNDVSNDRHEVKNEQPAERKSDEPEAVQEASTNEQAQFDEASAQNGQKAANVPADKPEGGKSPIPLNEYGFPASLIPLQKYPSYPYSYPFIYDSYGNFQTVQQYPVLPPSYYPQEGHKLPAIDQPMFQVGHRRLEPETTRDEKALPASENSLSAFSNDAIKNNGNKNSEIPDAEIPPVPFTIKKN